MSFRLPRRVAFWLLGTTLGALLFGAAAPSPMYVLYQREWGFSALVLTAVYAVNALALLCTLVVAGSLSDQAGRRPALIGALLTQLGAMALLAEARGVAWLVVARVVQGISTGVATGAISAALLDLQPPDRPKLGGLVAGIAPSAGLAAGALAAGALVQYGPSPTHLVYWLLFGAFVVALVGVLLMPETVRQRSRPTLQLRLGLPAPVRSSFTTLAPSIVAFWSLSGLYLSLGPSIGAVLLHSTNHLAGGSVIVALAGAGALASVLVRDWSPARALTVGSVAVVAGVGVTLSALHQGWPAVFYAGSVLAGLGFGPAFTGAFRTIVGQAPADHRAEVIAAVYVVAYLALSVPAVIAGLLVTRFGLVRTAYGYGTAVMLLATGALIAFHLQRRHTTTEAGTEPADHAPACPGTVPVHSGR